MTESALNQRLLPRVSKRGRLITNLSGLKFGRLTVIRFAEINKNHRPTWWCQCECGNQLTVVGHRLRSENTRSCGCLQREKARAVLLRHGQTKTRTHKAFMAMWSRCTNPNATHYHNYGGRGITICSRWRRFEAFLADMGPCPEGLTLERKDNEKGYSPDNCRWATLLEQARNKRNNVRVILNNKEMILSDAIKALGSTYKRIRRNPARYNVQIL